MAIDDAEHMGQKKCDVVHRNAYSIRDQAKERDQEPEESVLIAQEQVVLRVVDDGF